MDTRELLILLLGLAIVGVILRGLYVAIQARRGQLRLAIEKNIPAVDLDALEMAELPAGGARVVQRSPHEVNLQNSRIQAADARARKLDLADQDREQEIPVLMDAVEVAAARRQQAADDILLDYPDEATADYRLEEDDSRAASARGDHLSSVAPDYYDDDAQDSAGDNDPYQETSDYPDDASYGQEDDSFEEGDDAYEESEAAAENTGQAEQRREPSLDLEESFEEQLDAFPMSAGDRIGESPRRPVAAVRAQPQENTEPAASALTTLRQGLFDRFKIRRTMAGDDDDSAELMDDDPVQDALATVTHLDEERESLEEHVAPIAEPSEVLVVNVMAAHGRRFAGHDLMEVLVGSGMKFGDMNIFHQRLSAEKRAPVIFSVANILNPGTFDLNNMESFSTPGISLFLALPTAINNLDALERMLKCARDLAGQLGGEMKDDNRNGMTGQTIEHYRQRVRDFELRRLKSAASRG